MSVEALRQSDLTEKEYLASEPLSEVKREYLGGVVHAMAGAEEAHNYIAMNLYRVLGNQLRGRRCEAFGSDMQVRFQPSFTPDKLPYHYYPDAMVACDPTDRGQRWRERPAAIFEILSESTRHVDEGEKRLVYFQLPSLEAYVRIEQTRPEAVVEYLAPNGWKRDRVLGLEGTIHLPSLEIELPMAELYERVVFAG